MQTQKQPILVQRLYTAGETRRFDQQAIAAGTPGIVLMKRAGRAVFDALRGRWPEARSITVVCGRGNNAGDGYVVAGLALEQGLRVQLIQLGDPAGLTGDAGLARDWALKLGISVERADDAAPELTMTGDVIVDALLGSGLRGEVRAGFATAIRQINAAAQPVLAVDLPSGLCPDRGVALGAAVMADLTVTLIGAKRGLFTGAGLEHAGRVEHADCGVASVLDDSAGTPALTWQRLGPGLPRRTANAHKGQFGHVLIVGGEHGMGGAAAMAAEAALRTGAGLVTVATRAEHVPVLLTRLPELMVRGLDASEELGHSLARASVIAVGPGLGQSAWSRALLREILTTLAAEPSARPLVLDADALNLVAADDLELPSNCIITPHPGEAARLLGRHTGDIQQDRFDAALALARRYRAVTILKGAGTIIAGDKLFGICTDGNPAMATAGMGDVLTGIVAGLLAQNLPREAAAPMAACLHGHAGDVAAARFGSRGLTASDLLGCLREALNAPDAQDSSGHE